MLGFKSNKVQTVSSVNLPGRSADTRRHSRGSQSGSLHGFEQLEVCNKLKIAEPSFFPTVLFTPKHLPLPLTLL